MGKRRSLRQSVNLGHKAGKHKSDRHWIDPEGNKWDSRYEYVIWRAFSETSRKVRRTDKGDTMAFTLPIKGGKCGDCGSAKVGQQRTYTPDLHVAAYNPKHEAEYYYVEAKGYLRAKERSLLRAFYKAHPDAPVRFLFQRDFPATARSKTTGHRSSIMQWFAKFLPNFKAEVWNGTIPKGW